MTNQLQTGMTWPTTTDEENEGVANQTSVNTTIAITTVATGKLESDLEYVSRFISIFVLLVGLTGNILTIVVMSNRKFRNLSSSRFLLAMAVSDTLLLLTQQFNRRYMQQLLGLDLRALSTAGCKAFFFIFKTSKMTSSWFVVSITLERFIAVWFPLKAKLICTNKLTCVFIMLNYILIGCFNATWTFSSDIVNGICYPDVVTSSTEAKYRIYLMLGSLLYSIIPLVILLIFTPSVVLKLLAANKRRRSIIATHARRAHVDTMRISVMVLGILISYIILVMPITVYINLSFYKGIHVFGEQGEALEKFMIVAQMLEQINYGINFFLYILISKQFRQHLCELCCCSKRSKTSSSIWISSSLSSATSHK